jgi:hypothetical protein
METDDAALARALMMEEMAAADAAGIDYSPTFRKRRRDSMSDDEFESPRRRTSPSQCPNLRLNRSPRPSPARPRDRRR